MDYQKLGLLMDKVIENEFKHIQEHHEREDINKNIEVVKEEKRANELFEKLLQVAPEQKSLINDYDEVITNYWIDIARYYFKKGVITGTSNLNFVNTTIDGRGVY
ncbi:hypothetical protein [Clostridium botulinum]|uniref:hypothetical protein n=1 Tax=Clostridium botulinum TaxID=1491 RepID=UPI0007745EAA|nr:hypothetical protein [Clostridium botulinum]MBY6931275.1 hypothetical protein [Clostridium botulinum]NFG19797.1 hypothetical protein [Clostridium botulinum]NFO79881.1 hypothetical protein [Clostridium botulinum]